MSFFDSSVIVPSGSFDAAGAACFAGAAVAFFAGAAFVSGAGALETDFAGARLITGEGRILMARQLHRTDLHPAADSTSAHDAN